jgi:hypothetical protein
MSIKLVYAGCINTKNLGDDILLNIFIKCLCNTIVRKYNINVEVNNVYLGTNDDIDSNNWIKTYDISITGGGSLIHPQEISYTLNKLKCNYICGTGITDCPDIKFDDEFTNNLINKNFDRLNLSNYIRSYGSRLNIMNKNFEFINNYNKVFGGYRGNIDVKLINEFNSNILPMIYDIGMLVEYIYDLDFDSKYKLITTNKRIISINLAYVSSSNSYYDRDSPNVNNEVIYEIIHQLIIRLINNNYYICLLPFSAGEYSIHRRIYNMIVASISNAKEYIYCPTNFESYNETLYLIKHSYCVIGTRLHANIVAAGFQIPFLMLAYGYKCINFAESVNMQEYFIPTYCDHINSEVLYNKLNQLIEHHDIIKSNLNTHVTRAKELYYTSISNMLEWYTHTYDEHFFTNINRINISWDRGPRISSQYGRIIINKQ